MKLNIKYYFVAKYEVEGITSATIKEAMDYISDKPVLGLDIETSADLKLEEEYKHINHIYQGGLDPYFTNICMLQIGDLKRVYNFDVRDFSIVELEPLINFLHLNRVTTFVGVFLKFEVKHLLHSYGIKLLKLHDCLLVDTIHFNGEMNMKYSMAAMAKRYLGIKVNNIIPMFKKVKIKTINELHVESHQKELTPFEVEEGYFMDKSTRLGFVKLDGAPFTLKQLTYGGDDIMFPLLIKEQQDLGRKIITNEGKVQLYNPKDLKKMENYFTNALGEMELNGLPFHRARWITVYEGNLESQEKYIREFNAYIVKHYPNYTVVDLFNPEPACTIDLNNEKSTKGFFKSLDSCPLVWSKKKQRKVYSLGAKDMLPLVPVGHQSFYMKSKWKGFDDADEPNKEDIILAFLLINRTKQLTSTFGLEWLKYVHPITLRVHTNFKQIVSSGRQSSYNPNMQNMPNSKRFRDCFTTMDNDMVQVELEDGEKLWYFKGGTVITENGIKPVMELTTEDNVVYL